MEFEQMIQLIQTVSDSKLTRFTYEENGVKLDLKKEEKQVVVQRVGQPVPERAAADGNIPGVEFGYGWTEGPAAGATEAEGEADRHHAGTEGQTVTSPLVGTFYASPSPEAEPYVKVGDHVSKGQVLGIVEAMKLMNEIESEYEGTVKEILVENESVIEFGQPMFVIG